MIKKVKGKEGKQNPNFCARKMESEPFLCRKQGKRKLARRGGSASGKESKKEKKIVAKKKIVESTSRSALSRTSTRSTKDCGEGGGGERN